MLALVTGGAGFIGSSVVELLLDSGWHVRVLDNLSTGFQKNLEGLEVEFVRGDVRDRELLPRVTKGVDAVFHLAASIGNAKSLAMPQEDAEVNAVGTVNVLEAARRNGVGRFVYSSSAGIFGELLTPSIAEDHPQNPISPYGVSKLAGEKQALAFAHTYGFTAVALRYFNVYGVRQRYDAYGNVIPIFARRLAAGEPITIFGDGEQTRDFVNVKDVARANVHAAVRAPRSGVYNVGCGSSITINSLAEECQEASGLRTTIAYGPPRPGDVRHCKADISRMRADLGVEPSTDIRSGLTEYFEWFLSAQAMAGR